jgi:cyclopropane-fatty-acyl-phospholipid synthase
MAVLELSGYGGVQVMTTQSLLSDVGAVRAGVQRDEKSFFEIVGPALKDQPLTFLCGDREYRFGASADPTVVRIDDADTFRRILTQGNLGLGEAYMDQKVEIVRGTLEGLLLALLRADVPKFIRGNPSSLLKLAGIYLRNFGRGRYGNVQSHYDAGIELFEIVLDPAMAYSCAYVTSESDSLEQMQINKFDRICRKLRLQPGERLLDIGCGFGGLLIHAARHYGTRGVGITISRDQHRRAQAKVAAEGLSDRVEILYASHKTLPGRFDKIVSVGMMEHLTKRDLPVFMRNVKNALVEDGLTLMHMIGCNSSVNRHDPFIQKYIFPGSRTPKLSELAENLERNELAIQDVENIGRHYGPTAHRWYENLQNNYAKLDHRKYDARFKRLWEYYLSCGMAAATESEAAVWQVLAANGRKLYRMPYQRV